MRIIAGRLRGRRLAPVVRGLRPSTDRMRETLFAVLADSVREAIWVEPFAGTGAVALEALSRGASRLILNDNSRRALEVLNRNLSRCNAGTVCEVTRWDAFAFLRKLEQPEVDFVFLDPPYEFRRYTRLLTAVGALGSLKPSAGIILEVFKKTTIEVPGRLEFFRDLQVGDSRLLFLRPG